MKCGRSRKKRPIIDPQEALAEFEKPEVRARFDAAMKRWGKKCEPLIKAIRSAETLTAEDFNLRVHAA